METRNTTTAFLIRQSRGSAVCHGCERHIGTELEVEEYSLLLTQLAEAPGSFNLIQGTRAVLCLDCTRDVVDGLSALEQRLLLNRAEHVTERERRARDEAMIDTGHLSPGVDARLEEAFKRGQ